MERLSVDTTDPNYAGLRFRCIGPVRGGRVLAVAGHPTDRQVFYFGGCAGGIWKTVDGGQFWENVSDGYLRTAAVGALTVSAADPNVIYAGMGESTIRLDVSYGDGVYKSTDAGRTWQHMGLAETKHISEIRVHPGDPDLVYVAAFGHAFGPNQERGVYRSRDGGESWELVLHKSDKAGAADLAMDATNPRILFASIYEAHRSFWNLSSGGDDSGLWKSVDGGDTWVDITRNKGLPAGMVGKIGVTVSPANPDRVWAVIESNDGVLYRSDDGGDTWTGVSDNLELIQRPWYYCHVFADPCDADTVYINNLKMWKSTDAGATFTEIPTPHGDNHDLWIDPSDPMRMIESHDGGANVSFNGGASWSSTYNQKTAQFYHLVADNRMPYHVLGTQQDNTSIGVPSATEEHVISFGRCYPAGTGESGYIASNPDDPDIVYVGAIGSSPGGGNCLQRYDHRTKQVQLVTVWPEVNFGRGAKDLRYRFAWTYPIMFSPHDSNTLYVAGNHVFKSVDEGHSWEPISPDLSKADESRLGVPGGPLTPDTSGAEVWATVFALAESPHEAGVLWAGTDDGLVHRTDDGGVSWIDITPEAFPEDTCVTMIEPSAHDADTVYLSATRYKVDDYAPYLFRSTDRGGSWERLDFPETEITRCVREDPGCRGLLFVGTETGVFVSVDGGGSWSRLQGSGPQNNRLPVVPVYDLVLKDDDLVIGTHGRSFWILDDIAPLRALTDREPGGDGSELRLVPPRQTERRWHTWFLISNSANPGRRAIGFGTAVTNYELVDEYGAMRRHVLDGGENPPDGAIVYYSIPDGLAGATDASLRFLDADGRELRRFVPPASSGGAEEGSVDGGSADEDSGDGAASQLHMSVEPGLNRFVWDLRVADCVKPVNDLAVKDVRTGPRVPPGTYTVELVLGGEMLTASLDIVAAAGVRATQDDLDAQFRLLSSINDLLTEMHERVNAAVPVGEQLDIVRRRLTDETSEAGDAGDVAAAAAAASAALSEVVGRLVETKSLVGARLRHPARLNAQLISLISVVASADTAPTVQAAAAFDDLVTRVREEFDALDAVLSGEVATVNELAAAANVPTIIV